MNRFIHSTLSTGLRGLAIGLATSLVVGCAAGDEPPVAESGPAADDGVAKQDLVPAASAAPTQSQGADFGIFDDGSGPKARDDARLKPVVSRVSRSAIPSDRVSRASAATASEPVLDERLRDSLKKVNPDDTVDVYVTLQDRPFDWKRVRHAKDANELDAVIQDRRVGTTLATASFGKHLQRFAGARMKRDNWIVPGVEVSISAREVEELARLPGVRRVSPATIEMTHEAEYTDGYSGVEARNGMRTTAFINAGFKGNAGGRSGGAIRVAQLAHYWDSATGEYDYMSWKHRGFVYCSGGSCWYRTTLNTCSDGVCMRDPSPNSGDTGLPVHSNTVMQVMAGSIESGSDSSITTTTGRIKRSGIAPGADIFYYVNEDYSPKCTSMVAALEQAIADKIDVLDYSAGLGTCGCGHTCDTCGMNDALANLREAGTLWVKSIGNNGDSTSCTATYPAQRRDGLTVGALDTSTSSVVYDSATMRSASSRGGMDLRTNGVLRSKAVAVADLVAPGCWTYQYFYPPTNGYGANFVSGGNWGCGTSFAAPAVAGAAALLRQQFNSISWPGNDVGVLITNMLLMGDGYASSTGAFKANRFDPRSGAGRVHMHYPANANLTAPWGWGTHTATLSDGDTVTYTVWDSGPESPSVTQWKGAMTWFETNYDDAADIVLHVIDTCNGNATVASDVSYDLRKRVTLTQSQISNKCLSFRISAYHIPAGQTRTVYVADYFHSGSTANH